MHTRRLYDRQKDPSSRTPTWHNRVSERERDECNVIQMVEITLHEIAINLGALIICLSAEFGGHISVLDIAAIDMVQLGQSKVTK